MADHIELPIEGMTCASCANRIERKLNKLDGVSASVNYATEAATVTYDAGSVSTDDLVNTVAAAGYKALLPSPEPNATTDAPPTRSSTLRQRLLISAALSLPVLLMSMIPALQFDYWQWLALQLTTPVVAWGAWPFHRAAFTNARHGAATMDTLISVGTLAAWGWSVVALFFLGAGEAGMTMHFSLLPSAHGDAELYLEVAAVVTTFLLAGRYAEERAKRLSGEALTSLMKLGVKRASVLGADGTEVSVPVEQLKAGDHFVVRPGEKVATDGRVVEGTSAVDNSLITGESVPVEVGVDDEVIGASLNAGGRLVVEVTRVGNDTALARIAALVAAAQAGKAPVQRLADRISGVFVPIVIVVAAATLMAWLLFGDSATQAFSAAVAVLIIACPCALGLATPTAMLVGTGRGAQLGILIRSAEVLESTRRTDTVVLDKTGTITSGQMKVSGVYSVDGADESTWLPLVKALETASEHPVGRAIAAHGEPPSVRVDHFVSHQGLGVEGQVDGQVVLAGRPAFLAGRADISADVTSMVVEAQGKGEVPVVVALDGSVVGVVTVGDTIKVTSADGVAELRRLGLRTVMLSGDSHAAAQTVARGVGIDEVVAEVLPQQKFEHIKSLQEQGKVVAMVGDGVNDAAALTAADLGIAMGTGTDVAMAASDITLMSSDVRSVADAITLSRRTLRTIKVNLFWAFAYNVAAIPLAAAGLLNPLIAGAAMALSSVFVVTNSLRLRRFRSSAQ